VKKVQKIDDLKVFAVKIVKIKDEEAILSVKDEFFSLIFVDKEGVSEYKATGSPEYR